MWPEAILEAHGCRANRNNAARKTVRIHGSDVGIPDQIDAFRRQPGEIGFPGPRVGSEILRWRELSRVDEDRYHDPTGALFWQLNQRHMAIMGCDVTCSRSSGEGCGGRRVRFRGSGTATDSTKLCGQSPSAAKVERHRLRSALSGKLLPDADAGRTRFTLTA